MSTGTDLYSMLLVHTKGTFCNSLGNLNTFRTAPSLPACTSFSSCLVGWRDTRVLISRSHWKPSSPVKPLPPCADQSSSYKKCSNKEKAVLLADPCWVPHGDALVVGNAGVAYMGSLSIKNRFHLLRTNTHTASA